MFVSTLEDPACQRELLNSESIGEIVPSFEDYLYPIVVLLDKMEVEKLLAQDAGGVETGESNQDILFYQSISLNYISWALQAFAVVLANLPKNDIGSNFKEKFAQLVHVCYNILIDKVSNKPRRDSIILKMRQIMAISARSKE